MKSMLSDIKQQIMHSGYAYLESFNPSQTTLQTATEIGETIEIPGIPVVQRIAPRKQAEAPRNIYSGNYGLGDFPLHTDLAHWYIPPPYMILRCIAPGPNVFTRVVDFSGCLKNVPEGKIQRAQSLPRMNLNGRKHILRLFQKLESRHMLRWDELFIVPANYEAFEVRNHLVPAMSKCATTQISFSHPADTLIIDNWRMLHGRSSVPTSGLERIVERVYLWEFKE